MSILVVGGTKGIGLAIARKLASEHGGDMFLVYARDDASAQSAVAQITELGATPILLKADIGHYENIVKIVDALRRHGSSIDVLVHTAVDFGTGQPLLKLDPEEYSRIMMVKSTSLWLLVRAAQDIFSSGASIIYLSGRAAHDVMTRDSAAAGPSGAAGECMVRYLAAELAPRSIRINTLRSGPVDTPLLRSAFQRNFGPDASFVVPPTLFGAPLTVEHIASVASFLASPSAEMITGQTIMVDGGRSIVV